MSNALVAHHSQLKCVLYFKIGTRKSYTKRPWSAAETSAINRHFGRNIALKQLPGKRSIEEVIEKEKSLAGRSWTNVKDCIRNKMMKKKHVVPL